MIKNSEIRANVVKELKEAGYNSKMCSVSVRDCGYSTVIRVTVRSPYVNSSEVEKLLLHWRDVDYEGRTQEILMGGNTYLNVNYAEGVFVEVAKEWAKLAGELMGQNKDFVSIYEHLFLLKWDNGWEIRQSDEHMSVGRKCCIESLPVFLFKYNQFGTIVV